MHSYARNMNFNKKNRGKRYEEKQNRFFFFFFFFFFLENSDSFLISNVFSPLGYLAGTKV